MGRLTERVIIQVKKTKSQKEETDNENEIIQDPPAFIRSFLRAHIRVCILCQ